LGNRRYPEAWRGSETLLTPPSAFPQADLDAPDSVVRVYFSAHQRVAKLTLLTSQEFASKRFSGYD